MAAAYLKLVDRFHAHSGLSVIPNDLDQIHAPTNGIGCVK